jgi:bacterioferritin-associated ferredoxin
MIVCCCYGVSDRTIRQLVAQGADTPQEIEQACGAGADCGSCQRQVRQLIQEEAASGTSEVPAFCLPVMQTG